MPSAIDGVPAAMVYLPEYIECIDINHIDIIWIDVRMDDELA